MSFNFGSKGERELQQKYNTSEAAQAFYKNQMIDYLTDEMIQFIGQQEMLFVATADQHGNCDNSFRFGEAGFICVVDKHRIVYPEYKGNGVNASLGNIIENPHIGLLILDFYQARIGLHVNGKAKIIESNELIDNFCSTITEKLLENPYANRWILIEIDEAYIHCSKHIPQLKKLEKKIVWGSDDPNYKGGDFFKVKQHKKDLNK